MSGATAFVQNAYLVDNLDEACTIFNELFGIGPFIGGTETVLENHVYRGQPAEPIRLRGVFVQAGELNIELIELLSEGTCAFRDMIEAGGQRGIHHCAIYADDYEAEKRRFVGAGFDVVSEFDILGSKICYIDTRPLLGHMLEVYPEMPLIRGMYAQAREAGHRESGKAEIRPFTFPGGS